VESWPPSVECYTVRRFPPTPIGRENGQRDTPDSDSLFEVRIINNDYNTYGEVMAVVMLALGISQEEAYAVAWEVDHAGSCVVAHASREKAEAIADVIRTIGIEVQVTPISTVST
jgi:ATP-dependent Clp protease adapter protein ClpS